MRDRDQEVTLGPPFGNWFMALPRLAQWVLGIPLIAWCLETFWTQFHYVPKVGEPVRAIWFALTLFVASFVLQQLLRPKSTTEDARPKGLGDFGLPTATEDRPVSLLFGRVLMEGANFGWYGDFTKDPILQTQANGLFFKETFISGYNYRVGMQLGICRGPGVALRRILLNKKEIFSGTLSADGDRTDIELPVFFGGDTFGQGGLSTSIDFYTGSDSQPVNAYLDDVDRQRITTAATPAAPRYVGASYVVVRENTGAAATASDRGAYVGNNGRVGQWAFEVERFSPLFSGQAAGENKVGPDDCNPVNVAHELITNDEWGFGLSTATIDIASFTAAADTLRTEGNGFAMAVTSVMGAKELLKEVQRQIDGVIFVNPTTGLWVVKLARDDYDIDLVPQLTDDNTKAITGFTRGSWEDTTNQIILGYTKRSDEYKTATAIAQDMANAMIQGGGTPGTANIVTGESKYPGVMNSDNAAKLVWRDLRGQSYPLARGTFTVTKEFWEVTMGDVVAVTSTQLGYTKLPMRVVKVDQGLLQDNQIKLSLVQDVFTFAPAGFGSAPPTGWNPPVITLVAFPSDEQLGFEAPRGLIVREPGFAGDDQIAKVWCGARRQGGEIAFQVGQRSSSGVPSGSFTVDSQVFGFIRIGSLKNALEPGVASPTTSIILESTPDSQSDIVSSFTSTTKETVGVKLANLLLVGTEFMGPRSAENDAGSDVKLNNVYRGMLDSAQGKHAAGTDVYLIFVAGDVTETVFDNTNNVDIELRPESDQEVFSGSVTTIGLTMDKRSLRPYPPGASLYNGTATPFGTPDVEGDGSGLNGLGFDVDWWRRRFNTGDEVAELLQDFTPDASTEYRVRVFVDPDGANSEINGSPFAWMTGTGPQFINRLLLWEQAAAGTKIRVEIEVRHDIAAEVDLTGRSSMIHDVVPTSVRDGDFYLGGDIPPNTPTNSYTALATGTYVVNIGAAYSTSNVQFRLNGGTWTTTIAAGGTTGNIAGVVATDTIELRHTVSETPDPQYVELQNPSATVVAYGTFSA